MGCHCLEAFILRSRTRQGYPLTSVLFKNILKVSEEGECGAGGGEGWVGSVHCVARDPSPGPGLLSRRLLGFRQGSREKKIGPTSAPLSKPRPRLDSRLFLLRINPPSSGCLEVVPWAFLTGRKLSLGVRVSRGHA